MLYVKTKQLIRYTADEAVPIVWSDAFRYRAPSTDPTNTGDIRSKFRREAARRIAVFKRLLRMYIVEHNLLGMGANSQFNPIGVNQEQAYTQFVDYATNAAYSTIIQRGEWITPYVEDAYTTGLIAAWVLRRGRGFDTTLTGDKMFTAAVRHELEGAVDVSLQQISRVVLAGMRTRDRPAKIMRDIDTVLRKTTINRVNTICNVAVVQVHNAGRVDYLQALGHTHVGVVPELRRPGEGKEKRLTLRRDSAPCGCAIHRTMRYQARLVVDKLTVRDATISEKLGPNEAGAKIYTELPAWIAARMPKSVVNKLNKQLQNSLKNYGASKSEYETATKANKRFAKSETGMVEVVTAGDDLVCDECNDIAEDGPYTIDRARSLIPAHPNCRCAFVDVPSGEDDEEDE